MNGELKLRQNKTKIIFMIFIYFAYWLGIIQDLYYGIEYLIQRINGNIIHGSFPFMTGWAIIMFWGSLKPIDRRGILLGTGILVVLMFIDEIIKSINENGLELPLLRIGGMVIWFGAYISAVWLKRQTEKV